MAILKYLRFEKTKGVQWGSNPERIQENSQRSQLLHRVVGVESIQQDYKILEYDRNLFYDLGQGDAFKKN